MKSVKENQLLNSFGCQLPHITSAHALSFRLLVKAISYLQRYIVVHIDSVNFIQGSSRDQVQRHRWQQPNFEWKVSAQFLYMHISTSSNICDFLHPSVCAYCSTVPQPFSPAFPFTSYASSCLPSSRPEVPKCPINRTPNKQPLDQSDSLGYASGSRRKREVGRREENRNEERRRSETHKEELQK